MPAKRIVSSDDRIAFDELGTFSTLFSHYTTFHPSLSGNYSGDFRSDDAFRKQAELSLSYPRNRDVLADVLLEQNTRWGLDPSVEHNIELLRRDDSLAVVTGQQLGLFLSPLFIPYKTITTLLLAEKLRHTLKKPVIPVFWLHGEDHDFDETASLHLLDEKSRLESITYHSSLNGIQFQNGPVGRMSFNSSILNLIKNVETILPPSPNKPDIISFLTANFTPGTSLLNAFAHLIKRLFKDTGLVLFSIDDKRLKEQCSPLFHRELESPYALSDAVDRASTSLLDSYHVQVKVNPTNLFLMDDDSRVAIHAQNEEFRLKGHNAPYQSSEILNLLEKSPDRFSPNVIMRPLVQDLLLPTVAYVGGPGEIAYFAQLKPAYEWANVPMPIIFPRASLTLIEPSIAKILSRYNLPLLSYAEDPNKIFRTYVLDNIPIDIHAVRNSALNHIDSALKELQLAVEEVDRALLISVASTRARLYKDADRLIERMINAQKRIQQEDKRRFLKASAHLYPKQKLQERFLSPLHFLNLYGLDFFKTLAEQISIDTTSHQIIRL